MDAHKLIDSARSRHPKHAGAPRPASEPATGHLMLLPASDPSRSRLLRVPEDFEAHEAYRAVTGVIAQVEEDDPDHDWDDIQYALEERGFETLEFEVGPSLD